jgi:manganese efflux pump family protein
MSVIAVIGIAIGLAMDATAVAIGTSVLLGRVNGRQVFRFAFHFGLFQAGMPVLGWIAGRGLSAYIETWDHYVAFGLLAAIGGKAIFDVIKGDDDKTSVADPTRGVSLILLSVATSIDALAVGLSLAVLQATIWYPAAVIGVITAALTVCGMLLGSRIGQRFGLRVRVLGGVILIGIGIKILLEHTLLS